MFPNESTVAFEIVTPERRLRNRQAVQSRQNWRRRYANLAAAIKATKTQLGMRQAETTRAYLQAGLRAMQSEAASLMYARETISYDLKVTAYRYAPKEWIAAGKSNG